MKRTNKILLLVVLLATTLLLTACGGDKNLKNNNKKYIVSNAAKETILVDFDETKNNESFSNLEAYFVIHNGSLEKLPVITASEITYTVPKQTESHDNLYTYEELISAGYGVSDAYIKTYDFNIVVNGANEAIPFSYKEFNSNLSETTVSALGEGFVMDVVSNQVKYDKKGNPTTGLILKDTYEYVLNSIDFFEVNLVEGKATIASEPLAIAADQENYYQDTDELIKDKKYISFVEKTLTYEFTLSNNDSRNETVTLWLASTVKPLNTQTASFWNWIFLQMPIALFMSLIGSITKGSFAVAILVTTILVRTLAWPIYAKTNDMSMKMAVAQPEIDRLNRKYATRKDPESQQKQQMEMMQLYKKHKISMWGCLLPFLQMPIFFAMYEVVRRITIPGGQFSQNVSNTNFFWTDLASAGTVAKLVFTALVGITMLALQKISQIKPSYAKKSASQPKKDGQPNTENTMKMVSYVMVFMMIMTSYVTPGLALSYYWIIGNIYSIVQTLINRAISEKKHAKLQEQELYGNSREIIDAEFKKKGDK